ncbi:MAG: DNA-directed RNA polymerase subunit beta, partial [Clostridia bacterium]|nr:DNA-directed RNA polymerase subunit beta [Clostridia bacterium]
MKYVGVHDVELGKGRVRKSFASIDEVVDMPDLIEVQKNSYERFLKEDLKEVLNDVSPIYDFNGNLKLEFVDYSLDTTPKYTLEECRERDMTYATALYVTVRLTNNETGEVKESKVFMGDFPLMTENGTFIINGGERVIVSQLVRSPGVYYRESIDKAGKHLFDTQVIPSRGAWLEYEIDSNDVIWVRVDRARKLPVTSLLRALGYGTDEQIYELLGHDEKLEATMARDGGDDGTRRSRSNTDSKSVEGGLMEIYRRLRLGEVGTVDSADKLLRSTFFDPKRYDMMRVGRYKYNKKLAIALRLFNQVPVEDVIHPYTGEVLAEKGQAISREQAEAIQNAGVNEVVIEVENAQFRVIGNNFAFFKPFIENYDAELAAQYDENVIEFHERVHIPTLVELLERVKEDGIPLNRALKEAAKQLVPKHVLVDDIVSSVSYQFGLFHGLGE